jgi:adenylate cyclase
MIGADETGTLARLRTLRREVVEPLVAESGGRVFKTTGDGLLAEFPSTVQALRCAMGVQERLRGDELQLRVGVHQGDVVVEGDDLLGDGVNVAARLEGLAEPGGICISGRVREDAAGKIALDVEDLGEPDLKNIAQRHRVFRVRLNAPERPALALPDKPSLAVLPFQNISGDPEQEYFADGIAEDILTGLSRSRALFVIARNSSFTYKGRAVDVRQVARELGVRYLLEGSVRRAGGRLRVTTQLIDASTGAHVWADRYDGPAESVFDFQDSITEAVVAVLDTAIRTAEIEHIQRKRPDSLQAYDHYLRALRHFATSTRTSITALLEHARQAIALDPMFAPAYQIALEGYIRQYIQGWIADADLPRMRDEALDLADRGVAADNQDALMLATAGQAYAWFGFDLAKGITFTERALAVNPNSVLAMSRNGTLLTRAGQARLAIEQLERAMRLSPRDPHSTFWLETLARGYALEGNLETAHGFALRATQVNPNYLPAYSALAAIAALLGRTDEARTAAARVLAIDPTCSVTRLRERFPLLDPEKYEIIFEGLRRAGLPE